MAAKPFTWQQRGEYLAKCFGMTPQQFAGYLDTQIRSPTQQSIVRPPTRTTAGRKPVAAGT